MTYFLKVELLIRVLVGPCGNCAPTIEAQKKIWWAEVRSNLCYRTWRPSNICSRSSLDTCGMSGSFPGDAKLFVCRSCLSFSETSYNSYTLVSLFTFALLLLFGFNLGFSTPWRSSQSLLQITPNCVKWVFCWIFHPFPTMLFIANLTQLLYSRVESDFCRIGHVQTAPCSLQQQGHLHLLLKRTHHFH